MLAFGLAQRRRDVVVRGGDIGVEVVEGASAFRGDADVDAAAVGETADALDLPKAVKSWLLERCP
ncbi:hypothetical protein [Streptomyces sp. AK010]|uniref:hypothetical protein n=1 Tax=Streptomyces sp. AK010 TaxID=2723074 RepID=UPI00161CA172|nr:hypothetical protein [Streptomyces sp. AK010]MBB6414581.1 hypothetical protein [Streptomyces sp. AK010]